MKKWKQTVSAGIFVVPGFVLAICILAVSFEAYAAPPTHTSTSYGVDEVFFGSGGVNDATSSQYSARASLGDFGVGNTASTLYQAYAGFTTTEEPFIEFVVNAQNVDLGIQSTSSASTGTATFTIRAWLADGYIVSNASPPPQYSSYTLTNMATTAPSSPGTEQFGINLRDNSAPADVGADPVQIPDNTFSFGQVATGYDVPNQYRYVNGETIAYSDKSTSVTEYTITYMMNVEGKTPAGTYTMNHVLVATATY